MMKMFCVFHLQPFRLELGRLFLSCVGSQHPVFSLKRAANKAPYVPLCIIKL